MKSFEADNYVEFYSRVHKKNIIAEVTFVSELACIVNYEGVHYSLQNSQIIKVIEK